MTNALTARVYNSEIDGGVTLKHNEIYFNKFTEAFIIICGFTICNTYLNRPKVYTPIWNVFCVNYVGFNIWFTFCYSISFADNNIQDTKARQYRINF